MRCSIERHVSASSAMSTARSSGDFVKACGASSEMRVTVMLAVRDGAAVGLTVRTIPHDSALVSCIDREVRRRSWPRVAALSTLTTHY